MKVIKENQDRSSGDAHPAEYWGMDMKFIRHILYGDR